VQAQANYWEIIASEVPNARLNDKITLLASQGLRGAKSISLAPTLADGLIWSWQLRDAPHFEVIAIIGTSPERKFPSDLDHHNEQRTHIIPASKTYDTKQTLV